MSSFEVPPTRREAVTQRLRAEIASGALPPGTLLKDAELAGRLGVSITPVREAITQLAVEGLIDISPNRTRTVAGFSQKQALELVDVMELLAGTGFARGVDNLTDDDIAKMRLRFTEYVDALRTGNVPAAGASGADFSTIVIMAGGNRELQSLVDLVVARSLRFQSLGPDSPIWQPWIDGYRETLELLEAGDRISAVVRYRQIYVEYRAAVEASLWHHDDGTP
ncbi:GntR family transcriptional regulator [Nakamurella leprariae]|uniref:GntR family transcriptional regulator n=1 Tax=Nakamurella leprariae TaxID=2803911 RepID=A0A938Y854_9ACTN|nr:GntR family transcriptional regulator [Nakamurella leprariae]MBM9465722.1 GntR family transcriptional regulator [Nakamurella leprariae]